MKYELTVEFNADTIEEASAIAGDIEQALSNDFPHKVAVSEFIEAV